MNLTRGINLKKIAEMMPGASGAEVKGVCTEAGMVNVYYKSTEEISLLTKKFSFQF